METPLFLYDIFDAVRKDPAYDKPGLQELLVLQELLQHPAHGIDSYDALVFTCETLWLKNIAARPAFRKLFEDKRDQVLAFLKQLEIKAGQEKTLPVTTAPLKEQVIETPVKPFETEENDPGKPVQPPEKIPVKAEQEPELLPVENTITEGKLRFVLADVAGSISLVPEAEKAPLTAARSSIFFFGNEYFPVANRQLQQSWRYLKSRQHGESALPVIDVMKTIQQISKDGFYTGPFFKKKAENRLSLYIFLDQHGSMAAFESFGKELIDTAMQSKVHGGLASYYFYNVPRQRQQQNNYQLTNKEGSTTCSTDKIFRDTDRKQRVVLIYSDAGAARNSYNDERVSDTKAFIRYLNQHCANIAWINPLPKHRWEDNSAIEISRVVPMYEASRSGFDGAMNALKGKVPVLK